ncbi:MAG: hypothetical protein ABSC13_03270 [Dehalococcoidia bacterium]
MLDVFIHVTQGTSTWEAVAAIGAIAAAVATFLAVLVALFGRELWDRRRRPILQIDYDPCEPFCRYTIMAIGNSTASSLVNSHWIRVGVTNKGRGTARACKGKMLAVYGPDGSARDDRDPMLLRWSSMPSTKEFEPLDLARDERQPLDVVYTQGQPGGAFVAAEPTPAGFSKTLEAGPTHRVRLAVYADNAEPKTAEFAITYGGDIDSLKMDWA